MRESFNPPMLQPVDHAICARQGVALLFQIV